MNILYEIRINSSVRIFQRSGMIFKKELMIMEPQVRRSFNSYFSIIDIISRNLSRVHKEYTWLAEHIKRRKYTCVKMPVRVSENPAAGYQLGWRKDA